MNRFKNRPVQAKIKFYEDEKINRTCKPGDIILLRNVCYKKGKRIESINPHLVVKESDFIDDSLKNRDNIIKTESANSRLRMFNHYIDRNKGRLDEYFCILEKAKNPKIGDDIIKIEKFRLKYRVVEAVYDGVMNTRGFFIMPKLNKL